MQPVPADAAADAPCAECASSWWQGVVLALIGTIHRWHDVAVVEACEAEDAEKKAEARRALRAQMDRLNAEMCRGPSAMRSAGEAADAAGRAADARRDTEACVTASLTGAPDNLPLVKLFERIAADLEQNKAAVERLTSEHVHSGMRAVASIFDAALFSVRRVVEAVGRASSERERACATGERVLGQRRGNCEARCTALRGEWGAMQGRLAAFVDELADAVRSPQLTELARAIAASADALAAGDARTDCAMRVAYFAERVRELSSALRSIHDRVGRAVAAGDERALAAQTREVADAVARLGTETRALLSEEASATAGAAAPGEGDFAADAVYTDDLRRTVHAARMTDIDRAQSVARQLHTRRELQDRGEALGRQRAELDRLRSRAATMRDENKRFADAAQSLARIPEWIEVLRGFETQLTAYADDCIEVTQRGDAVVRAVDGACGRHLCGVAREARRVFSTSVARATRDFHGGTEELARRVQQQMQRFSRTAWSSVGQGRQMVARGAAPPESLAALDAFKSQNTADIAQNEVAYAAQMRPVEAIHEVVGKLVLNAVSAPAEADEVVIMGAGV